MRAVGPLLSLLLIAGCDDPPRTPVTLHTDDALLVAVDPGGDGDWQRLAPQTDVTVEVGERWRAVRVCGDQDDVVALAQVFAADDAGADVELRCGGAAGDRVPVPVVVTGAGPEVEIGLGASTGLIEQGVGTLDAWPGTWDLYAQERSTGLMMLQRDVVIDDQARIELDFAVDSFWLEEHRIVATDAIGTLTGSTEIELRGETTAMIWGSSVGNEIAAVPWSRLRDGDVQRARITASDGSGYAQHAVTPIAGDAIEVTLPAPLTGVAVRVDDTGFRAAWRQEQAWDRIEMVAYAFRDRGSWQWKLEAPATEAAADGIAGFPEVAAIPGWDPAWNVPRNVDVWSELKVWRDVDGGQVGASWTPAFGSAQ